MKNTKPTISVTFQMLPADFTDWSDAHVVDKIFVNRDSAIGCAKHLSMFAGYSKISIQVEGDMLQYFFSKGLPINE